MDRRRVDVKEPEKKVEWQEEVVSRNTKGTFKEKKVREE